METDTRDSCIKTIQKRRVMMRCSICESYLHSSDKCPKRLDEDAVPISDDQDFEGFRPTQAKVQPPPTDPGPHTFVK